MDTRAHLPPEVIGRITECLSPDIDKNDLLSLSLTSRACRMESQRVLFRTMEVKHGRGGKDLDQKAAIGAHILFLDAIINAPLRLGPYVRTYTCTWLAIAPVEADFHSSFQENPNRSFNRPNSKAGMYLWNKIYRALPLMTTLEHLTLAVGNVLEWGHSTNGVSILRNCRTALKSLVWGSTLDFPTLAADVLPHQPSLRFFGVYNDFDLYNDFNNDPVPLVTDFSPDALIHLNCIKGTTSALLACLSGRDIEAVSWMNSNNDKLDLPGQLFGRIRYLCISESSGLNNVVEHLTAVEVLCFKTYSWNWNSELSQLTSLVSLRTLILQNRGRWDPFDNDEVDVTVWRNYLDAIAVTAFISCSTLQCILVEVPGYEPWTYLTIKRAGDGMEFGTEVHLSEMMDIFEPWMPRPLTDFADIYCYM